MQFSIDRGYVGPYGKLRNHSKVAPGGLWKRLYNFFVYLRQRRFTLRQRRFTFSPLRHLNMGQKLTNIHFFV